MRTPVMVPGLTLTLNPSSSAGAPKNALSEARHCIVFAAGTDDLHVDRDFLTVFGYDDPLEVSGKPFSSLVHPEDRDRIEEIHRKRALGDEGPAHYEFRGLCRNGDVISLEVSATTLSCGGNDLYVMHVRDVTVRRHWEKQLRESEEKYRTLFENSMDAIYISRRDGRLMDVNQAFLDLFGYTREEAIGLNAKEALRARDRQRFVEEMRQTGYLRDFELTLARKDGTLMECLLTLSPGREEGGRTIWFQGIVRDITAFRKAQEEVRYLAYHDTLTGLPNRILFSDRLEMAIVNAQRNRQHIAVMMLDLDRFKDVNDTFGHGTGDKLLRAVADRLQETVRRSDTVARMGGDEFLLVVPEINIADDALVVGEKILKAFRGVFSAGDMEFCITCSIGIAIFPDHGSDGETLVKRADTAMYEVKRDGRNGCRLGSRDPE